MAELHVQPKKKSSILPWILLALGLAALIWYLTRNKDTDNETVASADTTTTVQTATANTADGTAAATGDWNGINWNAPAVSYEEVTDKNITVRGAEGYGIYGLGENVLFDEGKATIRTDAEANLKQIVSSIGKRYNGGDVRVYGFTDAQGAASANKDLAAQRAEAVKTWLQGNGIDGGHISLNAVGEGQPAASNGTEEGRQQNRRVEIVARKAGS